MKGEIEVPVPPFELRNGDIITCAGLVFVYNDGLVEVDASQVTWTVEREG